MARACVATPAADRRAPQTTTRMSSPSSLSIASKKSGMHFDEINGSEIGDGGRSRPARRRRLRRSAKPKPLLMTASFSFGTVRQQIEAARRARRLGGEHEPVRLARSDPAESPAGTVPKHATRTRCASPEMVCAPGIRTVAGDSRIRTARYRRRPRGRRRCRDCGRQ